MATETTEKKDESKLKIETEPHVLRLAKAMNMSMENLLPPDEDLTKKTEVDPNKKVEETPEQKKAREDSEAATAAAAVKKPEPTQMRPVVVVKREEKKPEVDETKKKEIEVEQEYIKTLNEDQQYEVELARFAERNGKAGQTKKLLDYYRAAEKFVTDNPDLEPDSNEFAEFVEKNEPKLSAAEKRKLERQMISEETAVKVRQEVTREFDPVVRRLNEIQSAPELESSVTELQSVLTEKPQGEEVSIEPETFTKISSLPYREAVKQFPVEAPIVSGAIVATKELTKIWNEAVSVDENNPTHQWLIQFIAAESAKILSAPKEQQLRDGRQFLPIGQFAKLEQTNPELARNYYTFSRKDLVDRIAKSSVEQYRHKVKELSDAGFTRKAAEKKSPESEVKTEERKESSNSSGSPRAVGHTMTGAGGTAEKPNFDDLPPHLRGVAKVMNTA